MSDRIPFAVPDITESEINAVVEVLKSGWITTGSRAKEFEQAFGKSVGATHTIMVNSCTAALHLALEAVGVKEGDEVIVPAMTFAATAEVVRYLGAVPVLVDVLAADHNIDPGMIDRAITPRTRAVIPVHFAGVICDMDEIVPMCRARGIRVIDDAAHSFPAQYRGTSVGTLADITCFSFYATKTITTGEGGAATTENVDWADRMRIMSLHGISRDAWKRYMGDGSWYYEILAPGYKYNMTDIAAALGCVQLRRANEMLARRAAIAARYDAFFREQPELELTKSAADRSHAHHLYVIKLDLDALRISRAQFIQELAARGVSTSVHFIPLHLHPYYRDTYSYRPEQLPVAAQLYERSVSLPIYSRMTDEQVTRVATTTLETLAAFRR